MEIIDFQGMSKLPASTTEAKAQLGEDLATAKRAASWIDTLGKQTGGKVQSTPCKRQKCTSGLVAVKTEAAAVKSDAAPKKKDIIIELCSLESESLKALGSMLDRQSTTLVQGMMAAVGQILRANQTTFVQVSDQTSPPDAAEHT